MFRFGDPGGRMYTTVGASNVNLLANWTNVPAASNGGTVAVQASGGRQSGSCLRFSNSGNGAGYQYITKTLDSRATWGVAFAVKVSILPTAPMPIVSWMDVGTTQCDLRINADGSLSVTRSGTVLGTVSPGISAGAYNHIEWKLTVDPSAGVVQVWLNGVSRLSLTSQNTRVTANSTANTIALGEVNAGFGSNFPALDIDDFIVYDSQTTDANGFTDISSQIGDCGLIWLMPTGAGTTTQFTPDSGSNFARVNEATPDGDASYVNSANVGDMDTYAMADLVASATVVKSVASVCYARKTDVGSRGMRTQLRSAGANAAHATEIALGNSYVYNFQNWGQNPNNGSPIGWTPTSVNSLEIGQKVSS